MPSVGRWRSERTATLPPVCAVTVAVARCAYAATLACWYSCVAMTAKASSTPPGRGALRVILMGTR